MQRSLDSSSMACFLAFGPTTSFCNFLVVFFLAIMFLRPTNFIVEMVFFINVVFSANNVTFGLLFQKRFFLLGMLAFKFPTLSLAVSWFLSLDGCRVTGFFSVFSCLGGFFHWCNRGLSNSSSQFKLNVAASYHKMLSYLSVPTYVLITVDLLLEVWQLCYFVLFDSKRLSCSILDFVQKMIQCLSEWVKIHSVTLLTRRCFGS